MILNGLGYCDHIQYYVVQVLHTLTCIYLYSFIQMHGTHNCSVYGITSTTQWTCHMNWWYLSFYRWLATIRSRLPCQPRNAVNASKMKVCSHLLRHLTLTTLIGTFVCYVKNRHHSRSNVQQNRKGQTSKPGHATNYSGHSSVGWWWWHFSNPCQK